MRLTFLKVLFILFFPISAFPQSFQDSSIIKNLKFINYLIKINELDDANYLLKNIDLNKISNNNIKDSIKFLIGKNYFSMNDIDSSNKYFYEISKNSNQFISSRFFSAYNFICLEKYDNSKDILNDFKTDDLNIENFRSLYLSAIALLKRNYNEFEILSGKFDYNYSPTVQAERSLPEYFEQLKNHKNNSMFLAGLMSAVIPGLGKVYAGKKGEGLAAFIIVSSLAATTFENYKKAGIKNIKTIFFGSVFTAFYIGNIWGSAFSVKIKNDEFNKTINRQIMLDINIPLHTIFY
ncbi:MAG: hypothetical protein WC223_11420 [Bacteroidales bacterium]|jgi:hypothetical protein